MLFYLYKIKIFIILQTDILNKIIFNKVVLLQHKIFI